MNYTLRISVPDKPGVLGAVATSISRYGANIITLHVIESGDGFAVDDLTIHLPKGGPEILRTAVEEVPGAIVEGVRSTETVPMPLTAPLELAAGLATSDRNLIMKTLVDGLPGALWSNWSWAIQAYDGRPTLIAASPGAPSLSNVETPWLPLEDARRLSPAQWMPPAWRMGRGSEAAAVPLFGSYSAVLVARRLGPRFTATELRQLSLLVSIAVAARETSEVSAMPAGL